MKQWKNAGAFEVPESVSRPDMRFISALTPPVAVYGVMYVDGMFRRIPETLAKRTNEGVTELHADTAGGRARFVTNSPYVILHAEMPRVSKMPHFAVTGSAGFDLYADNEYCGTFVPPMDMADGYDAVIDFPEEKRREITVHFPLYSRVSAVYFGVSATAELLPAAPYKDVPPAVFYGSSITQGGCASRPGLAYQNILSRLTGIDHVNLGFSGSAKGEACMAEYIAALPMSAFILDYDHNAPTPEHLAATHEAFFKTVRKANPTLPVLLMSRPKAVLTADEEQRLAVVRNTYNNARAAGDENVYLLTGPELMAMCGNEGTVDNCHPNDLGFVSMARALAPILSSALSI